ncbi:hypothetical protein [Thermodesulfobacterium sp. TA1]|nr:hypothetical protein [Thermodesulfobacterium sp. TA1]
MITSPKGNKRRLPTFFLEEILNLFYKVLKNLLENFMFEERSINMGK